MGVISFNTGKLQKLKSKCCKFALLIITVDVGTFCTNMLSCLSFLTPVHTSCFQNMCPLSFQVARHHHCTPTAVFHVVWSVSETVRALVAPTNRPLTPSYLCRRRRRSPPDELRVALRYNSLRQSAELRNMWCWTSIDKQAGTPSDRPSQPEAARFSEEWQVKQVVKLFQKRCATYYLPEWGCRERCLKNFSRYA